MKDLLIIAAEISAAFTRTEHDGHTVRPISQPEPDTIPYEEGVYIEIPNFIDKAGLVLCIQLADRYGFEHIEVLPSDEIPGNVKIAMFNRNQ